MARRPQLRPLYLLFALLLFVFIAYPRHAAAEAAINGDGLSILPAKGADPATTDKGYFVYEVQPGKGAAGALVVQNTSAQTMTVQLEVVSAMTAQTGGSAYAMSGVERSGAATWINLSESSVEVAPGMQREVSFTVQVPGGVAARQYLAGVAAYVPDAPAGAATDEPGPAINLQVRQVVAVQVDVPGAWQPSMNISGVELLERPGGWALGVHLQNDGDVFLKPRGKLVVSDASGLPLATQVIDMDTFVPGTEVTYPVALANRPAAGDYKIVVEMSYADSRLARYDNTLKVAEPASSAAEASAAGPLVLPGAAEAPAAAQADPVRTSPVASQTGVDPWMFIAGGVLLALVGLLFIGITLRRRPRTA